MTEREQDIARMVATVGEAIASAFTDAALDSSALGFCLWVFEFREDPFVACVSNEFTNARRPELIRLMREHLAKLEEDEERERASLAGLQ